MVAKNKYLSLAVLFSFMFALTMASAAVAFVAPASAGDTVTGDYVFNITTSLGNVDNCTWATTADSVFNTTLNSSADQTVFNFTFDSTGLTDAEDTTLTVQCFNTTANESNTLVINVDNTNPTCSYIIDRNTVEFQDGIGILTTQSSSDTTDLTYAWTLYRSDGTSSTTSTVASPTFSGSDFDQIDELTLELIITDEASQSTACANQSILVKGANGDTVVASGVQAFVEEKQTEMIVFGMVIFLLLVAVITYFVILNEKK